ncbi:MAG: phosphoribosylglycinamide formyltransferase [Pseudomonadota bacterium]
MKKRVAVLISGRGSNMSALLDAAEAPDYPASIALVLSNRPDAAGLARAADAGVATAVVDHRAFGTKARRYADGRDAFDAAVERALTDADVDVVCLAGFMRLFGAAFAERWKGRILNIHPTLLPAFPGLHVHRRMIEAGVKIAGCTVHFVVPETDAGPIVGQAALAVRPSDDEESLAARILALEHQLYPRCLELVANGRARLASGDVTEFADALVDAEGALVNPVSG